MIAATTLFLVAATQTIEVKAQWDVVQNTTNNEIVEKPAVPMNTNSERAPFAGIQSQPLYAAPPGETGDGQKVPVEDVWLLPLLAVGYGIYRRCRKAKE